MLVSIMDGDNISPRFFSRGKRELLPRSRWWVCRRSMKSRITATALVAVAFLFYI